MRVALIDPGAYTPPYDDRLAASLAARGHEVHLLTSHFRFGAVPAPNGYRREELFFPLSSKLFVRAPRSRARLGVKALEYLPSVVRVERRLRRLEPDVVHLQWLVRPDLDLRWLKAAASRRPTAFTAHDLDAMLAGRREAWLAVLRAVDAVVVHSRRSVDELVAAGIDPERVTRIPHAVFDSGRDDASPPEGSTLLFFGLLRAYKGLDVLIAALPSIAAAVPEVRLVIAGDPLDPVEPLRRQAAAAGVEERIEWRLGYRPDEELEALLAGAAAVVLPYRRRVDASGALAKALGHGRPVVVSDVANLGETVTEFGAGRVVPPEDVRALADACIALLSSGEREAAFRGALAARKALTWAAAAERHEELYRRIGRGDLPAD